MRIVDSDISLAPYRRWASAVVAPVALAYVLCAASTAEAPTAARGALDPVPCNLGSRDCVDLPPLDPYGTVDDVAVSADGRSVYATYAGDIRAIRRNPHSGRLRQLRGSAGRGPQGCNGGEHLCRTWEDIVLSPDGRQVYAINPNDSWIAIFERNRSSGGLRLSRHDCVPAEGFHCSLEALQITHDGRHAYSFEVNPNRVTAFRREARTGALRELPHALGCLSSPRSRALVGADCRTARGLGLPTALALSRDGRHMYVASDHGIAVLRRNEATGALVQPPGKAGCLARNGRFGCGPYRFDGGFDLAIGRGGGVLYALPARGHVIAVIRRDVPSGALSQLPGRSGCVAEARIAGCTTVQALQHAAPLFLALSQFGRNLYVSVEGRGAPGGIMALERHKRGALRQLPGGWGCVGLRRSDGCKPLRRGFSPGPLAVTPDGRHMIAGSDGLYAFRRRGIRAYTGPATPVHVDAGLDPEAARSRVR